MFIEFLYALRARKVPVGSQEAVSLAKALALGLHENSLDGFYHVARSILIHDIRYFDDYDVVFSEHFKGVAASATAITEELLAWLREPQKRRELTPDQIEALEKLDLDEVLRRLRDRLAEQKERHDGGNHWVGTGGTSPFGRGGVNPSGVSIGGSGGRSGAVVSADARHYKPYRSDVILDTRQIEVALRKLRVLSRDGAEEELDIEGTIRETARNAGELEVVLAPPRKSNTRVILMMDVGGSMDPHAYVMSQLFSAAKRASHFKELHTFYFHNCVYGRVWKTENFLEPMPLSELFGKFAPTTKLVLVGDALMAPYELHGSSGYAGDEGRVPGIEWLRRLAEHFHRHVWLNPEAFRSYRGTTIDPISQIFPMFDLTLDGLGEAITELVRRGRR